MGETAQTPVGGLRMHRKREIYDKMAQESLFAVRPTKENSVDLLGFQP